MPGEKTQEQREAEARKLRQRERFLERLVLSILQEERDLGWSPDTKRMSILAFKSGLAGEKNGEVERYVAQLQLPRQRPDKCIVRTASQIGVLNRAIDDVYELRFSFPAETRTSIITTRFREKQKNVYAYRFGELLQLPQFRYLSLSLNGEVLTADRAWDLTHEESTRVALNVGSQVLPSRDAYIIFFIAVGLGYNRLPNRFDTSSSNSEKIKRVARAAYDFGARLKRDGFELPLMSDLYMRGDGMKGWCPECSLPSEKFDAFVRVVEDAIEAPIPEPPETEQLARPPEPVLPGRVLEIYRPLGPQAAMFGRFPARTRDPATKHELSGKPLISERPEQTPECYTGSSRRTGRK